MVRTHFTSHSKMAEGVQRKLVLVGDGGVGKTTFVKRHQTGEFERKYIPTVGVEVSQLTFQTSRGPLTYNIWDTAGQERFRSVSKAYFRNALGAILMFDLTSRQSFDDLGMWINDLNTLCVPNAYIILIGNKLDLQDDRQIVESEAQAFAQRYNLIYLETSAKNGNNVSEAFARLGTEILRRVKDGQITLPKPPAPTRIVEDDKPNQTNKQCC